MAIGFGLKRLDLEGFTDGEIAQLAQVSAPVAQKWAGFLLPWMAELALAGTLVAIMWPKVEGREERRREHARQQNVRAAQQPPPNRPPERPSGEKTTS